MPAVCHHPFMAASDPQPARAFDRALLRNPLFARLWFIQAATQVGGNMALYAMTILVFDTTQSTTAVSVLFATYVLPQIVLSPFAGVIVDRIDLRLALAGPNFVRAVLMIGLALAGPQLPILLALNLGVSFTSVALTPAEGSMIPRAVPRPQLPIAMGIFNLTLQGSFAVGFAFIGPLLVTLFGPSSVLAVVAILYVTATVACIGFPAAPPIDRFTGRAGAGAPNATTRTAEAKRLAELRAGFSVVLADREISRPIVQQAAGASIAGVLGVLGPALAVTIGLQPDHLVVILVPLGIGVVAGVLGLRRFTRIPHRRAAELGLLAFGGLTASLALGAPLHAALATIGIPILPLVIAIALLSGAAYAIASVSAQTALLEAIPPDVRGRVFGVLASIVSTASLLPALVAGPLADRISAPFVLVVVGAGVALIALWSARSPASPAPPSGLGLGVAEDPPRERDEERGSGHLETQDQEHEESG
jgi:MFS family permease